MGRSSLEWLCFVIAVVRRSSSLAAYLQISYAKNISAPVCDWFTEKFCDFGHPDRTRLARLAPAASSVTLTFAGDGLAREARPGITFRLRTGGGSPAAADRRSHAVEHEACLDDFIDESNPVRVIEIFVDALDLAEMNFEGVSRRLLVGHRTTPGFSSSFTTGSGDRGYDAIADVWLGQESHRWNEYAA
jgi:hypothetical protein